ncbi:tetratricopeptide repeat protein [Wenzhouxiangella sp. AB-CW3]|uniref:tetratricopeptide repeat protein n=1 Tax=Wenzhouxiangella sp. AB-CW3 TaxID=2771012 RepID=UPI00168BD8E0|nr:tetratricopeptide repeat protein [Wenzhouxiangella sp. AB-CW3]QOC23836.1 tetratricopeptide repeat protein [Wenzhouxiangella sp. AB-CW3]
MSLINEVLKDLEKRREPAPETDSSPLPRTTRKPHPARHLWWIGAAALGGLALHWVMNSTSPPLPDQQQPVLAQIASAENLSAPTESSPRPDAAPIEVIDSIEPIERIEPVSAPQVSPAADTSGDDSSARADQPKPETNETRTATEPEPPASPAVATTEETAPDDMVMPDSPEDSSAEADAHVGDEPEPESEGAIVIQRAEGEVEHFESARRALARGQQQLGMRRLQELLDNDPGHGEARLLLASTLIRRGETPRAINLLDEGLESARDPAALAERLGRLLIEGEEPARARQVLEAHAPALVDAPDYHQLLAVALRQLGDHQAAVAAYRQLSEVVPGRGAVWVGLGTSHESLGQTEQAREAYQQALAGNDPRATRFARQRLHAIERDNEDDGD